MRNQNMACITLLILHSSIGYMPQSNAQAPKEKIFSADTKDVQAAIQEDPDTVNIRDSNNKTPLHHHIVPRHNAMPVTENYILRCPNGTPDNAGIENLQLLLQNNADPNAMDSHGNTPLHEAADEGRAAAFELLVQYGGFMRAQSQQLRRDLKDAMGPPHQSDKDAELGRRKIFETCLEYGADPRWLNSTAAGVTPFAIALLHNGQKRNINQKLVSAVSPAKSESAFHLWDICERISRKELQGLPWDISQLAEQLKHFACIGLGQSINLYKSFGTETADFLEHIGESTHDICKQREDYIIPATLLHAEILRSYNTQSPIASSDIFLPATVNITQEIQMFPKVQTQMQTFIDRVASHDRIQNMLQMAAKRVNNHTLSLPAFRHILQTYKQHITDEFHNISDKPSLAPFKEVRDQYISQSRQ